MGVPQAVQGNVAQASRRDSFAEGTSDDVRVDGLAVVADEQVVLAVVELHH